MVSSVYADENQREIESELEREKQLFASSQQLVERYTNHLSTVETLIMFLTMRFDMQKMRIANIFGDKVISYKLNSA